MRTLLIIITIIGLGVLSYVIFKPDSYTAPAVVIKNYNDCVAQGGTVLETIPLQCRTPDGNTFISTAPAKPVESKDNLIRVTNVSPNQIVQSPLVVRGEARGNWYFEASFPVELLDGNGKKIASAIATAKGEWMTTEFVPFQTGELRFATPETPTGTLILHKDNPSGEARFDDELRIPVRFSTKERSVLLYYYDSSKDKDASGNILCSEQGLVAVPRTIPITKTPVQDTIKLLLEGKLTDAERSAGITTEYPLPGVTLTGASQSGSTLTLSISDPQNKTSGGACRANILKAQVVATAKQFSGISTVRFSPSTLFQP